MTSTVLILGAGLSRAVSGAKRAMANRPPLDTDFFEVARLGRYSTYGKVEEVLEQFVGDYSSELRRSLERATTYLYLKAIDSSAGSIYHEGFLALLNLLNSVLAHTTNPLKVGRRSLIYRFLLNEINKSGSQDNISIITFNYDLLIEKTLNEIAACHGSHLFQFPDCYRLKRIESTNGIDGLPNFSSSPSPSKGIAVLKLHGSLNWLSRHTSSTPKPRTLFAPNREIHVANSPQIATNMTWRRNQRLIYMKPIIVPPVSGKRGMMHKEFSSLWSIAGKQLREADRIVVAGYSCPPLDIEARMLLSENLRLNDNKKLYVIDPNGESASKFIDICGVDHSTIYSSLNAWVRDAT